MDEMPNASGFSVGKSDDGNVRLTYHDEAGKVDRGWLLTPIVAMWLLRQLAAALIEDEPASDSKTGAL